MRTIRIYYSCPQCGLKDEPADVPARESPEESVLEWIEEVMEILARHHSRRSPDCSTQSLQNLKIPIPSDDSQAWVGKYTPPKPCPTDEDFQANADQKPVSQDPGEGEWNSNAKG